MKFENNYESGNKETIKKMTLVTSINIYANKTKLIMSSGLTLVEITTKEDFSFKVNSNHIIEVQLSSDFTPSHIEIAPYIVTSEESDKIHVILRNNSTKLIKTVKSKDEKRNTRLIKKGTHIGTAYIRKIELFDSPTNTEK